MSGADENIAWDQKLARVLVKALAGTNIHPNVITTVGMLSGLYAGYLMAQGIPSLSNWAALIFILAAFIDHADGEYARLVNKTSTFGHYYDHVAVGVSYVALFVGIGFGERSGPLGEWAVPMGVISGIAVTTIMSLRLGVELCRGKESIQQGNIGGFEPEDALYLVLPVALLGGLTYFLIAAAIGAPLFLVWVGIELVWTKIEGKTRS